MILSIYEIFSLYSLAILYPFVIFLTEIFFQTRVGLFCDRCSKNDKRNKNVAHPLGIRFFRVTGSPR